jgi:hypothetical protein
VSRLRRGALRRVRQVCCRSRAAGRREAWRTSSTFGENQSWVGKLQWRHFQSPSRCWFASLGLPGRPPLRLARPSLVVLLPLAPRPEGSRPRGSPPPAPSPHSRCRKSMSLLASGASPPRRLPRCAMTPWSPPPPWWRASLHLAAATAMTARSAWRWRRARRCHACSPAVASRRRPLGAAAERGRAAGAHADAERQGAAQRGQARRGAAFVHKSAEQSESPGTVH